MALVFLLDPLVPALAFGLQVLAFSLILFTDLVRSLGVFLDHFLHLFVKMLILLFPALPESLLFFLGMPQFPVKSPLTFVVGERRSGAISRFARVGRDCSRGRLKGVLRVSW